MTHALFYAALLAEHALRPRERCRSKWTSADALACLRSWAATEGRAPYSNELQPSYQLPNYTTIRLLFGSVQAAYACLGWPYHAYGGRRAAETPQGGPHETDEEDGSWMNGTPVREAWEYTLEWWEG